MGRARLQLNRENASLEEIERAMDCAPTKKIFIRLQAIAFLHREEDWDLVLQLARVGERQVLRWSHLFNARGIDGLIPRQSSGRAHELGKDQFTRQALPVVRDPARAEEVHWTGVKLHGWLKQALQVDISYSTVLRYLPEEDFRLKMPRRWPEGWDEEQRQFFVEELKELVADPTVELWFTDECGVEGDPRPGRRWAHQSDRIKIPYHDIHPRKSVLGAVCPQSGECAALVFNHGDREVFQAFLDHLATQVPEDPKKRRVLIMDNATWHKVKSLNWHHLEPKYLPPYSPDLKPIERLWLKLKGEYFSDYIAQTTTRLVERLCQGFNHFIDNPQATARLCSLNRVRPLLRAGVASPSLRLWLANNPSN